jgi:hypothetical protein
MTAYDPGNPWHEHAVPLVVVDEDTLTPPWPSGLYVALLPKCSITLKVSDQLKIAIDSRCGFFVARGKTVGCLAQLVKILQTLDPTIRLGKYATGEPLVTLELPRFGSK